MNVTFAQRNECISILVEATNIKYKIIKSFESKLFDYLFFLDDSIILYFNTLQFIASRYTNKRAISSELLFNTSITFLRDFDKTTKATLHAKKKDIIQIIGKSNFLKCPLCGDIIITNDEQNRSADEGSTTHYMCINPDCKYRKKTH